MVGETALAAHPRPVLNDCVVSHAVPEFGDFAMTGAEARIPRAFAGAEIGDRLEWGLLKPDWRSSLLSNLRNLARRLGRDRFAFRADRFAVASKTQVQAAE
jgi:hypothetical protein